MARLERDGEIFVLHLGDGDNRFTPAEVDAVGAALDEVAAAEGPRALVTVADGKIWHNGLDVDLLFGLGDGVHDYIASVEALYARLLQLQLFTVAAIQGHAFAGGAMFALAHDARVMRADRGFFCLPEVDLGVPFSEGMTRLIAAKVPQPARHRLAVAGERFGGEAAMAGGIVDAAVAESDVLATAMDMARVMASKAKPVLATIRRNFYADVIAALQHAT